MIGCAAGGFFLIPTLGMRTTVFVAAAVNLVIALVILIVDRIRDRAPLEFVAEVAAPEATVPQDEKFLVTARLGAVDFVRAFGFRLVGL